MMCTRLLFYLMIFVCVSISRAQSPPELVMQIGHNISYDGETTAAYSPDGKWLTTATGNGALWGELIVWNSKGEIWLREDGLPQIFSLCWSPDGKYLALGCNGEARVFEIATTRFVARTFFDDADVNTFDSVPLLQWLDATHLVLAVDRGDLVAWDWGTGRKVLLGRGERNNWQALAISSNGKALAVATREGVLLFDTQNRHAPLPLRTLQAEYFDRGMERNENLRPEVLAWSPDGKLLGGYDDKGRYAIWDAGSGKVVSAHLKDDEIYSDHKTWLWRTDNQGHTISRLTHLGQDKWLRQDEPASPGATRHVQLRSPFADARWFETLAVSPDGARIVSASNDGALLQHDASTGRDVLHSAGATRWANAARWSPDGKYLAVGYGRRNADGSNGEIVIYDAKLGAALNTLPAHVSNQNGETGVNDLAFSPDDKYLVSTGEDEKNNFHLRVWETSTWRLVRVVPDLDRVVKISFSPDGKMLAAGCSGGVLVWRSFENLLGGQTQSDLAIKARIVEGAHDQTIRAVAISPDNSLLITGADEVKNQLSAWDLTNGKLRARLPADGSQCESVIFSRDGQKFWTGHSSAIVEWDARSLRKTRYLQRSDGPCRTLTLSPDSNTLLAAFFDEITLFSLPDGQRVKILLGAKSLLNDAAFSPNGVLIAGADETGAVRIWNVQTGKLALTFFALQTASFKNGLSTRAVAITPDGSYGADTESEKLLRWRDGEQLLTAQELIQKTGSSRYSSEAVVKALAGQ